MRLIDSSDPKRVELWEARRLLDERVVLTTAVVRELQHCDRKYTDSRPRAALDFLREWVGDRYEAHVETHASDGLATMAVPEGYEEVMAELVAGTAVCEALAMAWTADRPSELRDDVEEIERLLARYEH